MKVFTWLLVGGFAIIAGCCKSEPTPPGTPTTIPSTPAATPPTTPAATPPATDNVGAADEYVVSVPEGNTNGVVKSDPSPSASQLEQIRDGTHVAVLSRSSDGIWCRIRYPYQGGSKQGWMHQDILIKAGSAADCTQGVLDMECTLKDGRSGMCRRERCRDLCPPGMSYTNLDTRCHTKCGAGCKSCQFDLCMDDNTSAPAKDPG